MRNITLIFVSFILASQSVLSASAAPQTVATGDGMVIEQNTTTTTLSKNTAPQSAPKKTTVKKKDPQSTESSTESAEADIYPPNYTPYYVLGGLVVAGGIIAAASGGGGGGGGDPAPAPVPDFNAESQRNYGLTSIKALSAYARGHTGQNATVAVIDSGFDTTHADLAANMLAGIDVVDNDGNVNNSNDGDYHGNWVSGVIASVRDGFGTHGVAYDAKILPIRAGADRGFTYADLTSAIDTARNNSAVDVINLSLGSSTLVQGTDPRGGSNPVYFETPLPKTSTFAGLGSAGQAYGNALANAEAQSKVVVFAAGNEGFNSVNGEISYRLDPNGPAVDSVSANIFFTYSGATTLFDRDQSSFDARLPVVAGSPVGTGTWLNVVATNRNNTITQFSNGCGDTKNFCLAAPGDDIVTTGRSGQYDTVDGTSFAAPHVSGAVAVLMSAFPNLTPEQVVDLLLTTATDLGAAGVDDVYGRGLVNLEEATRPQGSTTVAMASGASAPVPSGLLSSSFGDSLGGGSVAFLDGYGRVYNAPVKGLVTDMNPADLTDKFNALSQVATGFSQINTDAQAGSVYNWSASSDEREDAPGVAVASLGYMKGGSTSPLFSYQGSDTVRAGFGLNPAVYADQDANRMQMSVPVSEAASLRVGSAFSNNYSATGTTPLVSDNRTMGYDLEYAQHMTDNLDVAAFTGIMREEGQVLGSLFNGAFGVDTANTTFAGVSATYSLSPSVFVTGNYMYSTSDVNTENAAFAMDNIRSDSTLLGLVSTDVASQGDAAMVSLRQPLRNVSGQGRLSSISGYNSSGGYDMQTSNYDLTPSGREQTLEFAYNTPVGEAQSVTFTVGGSDDYANIAGQQEAHVLGVYKLAW